MQVSRDRMIAAYRGSSGVPKGPVYGGPGAREKFQIHSASDGYKRPAAIVDISSSARQKYNEVYCDSLSAHRNLKEHMFNGEAGSKAIKAITSESRNGVISSIKGMPTHRKIEEHRFRNTDEKNKNTNGSDKKMSLSSIKERDSQKKTNNNGFMRADKSMRLHVYKGGGDLSGQNLKNKSESRERHLKEDKKQFGFPDISCVSQKLANLINSFKGKFSSLFLRPAYV